MGREASVRQAYASIGAATIITLVLALLRLGLFLLAGMAALIIPFFYLLVRFLFVTPVIVLEHTGVRQAFSRSSELVRGSWWRVFGILMLLVLIVGVLGAIFALILGAVLSPVLTLNHSTGGIIWSEAITGLFGIFIQPIELGAIVLLYYDLRIRKEGFDLEVAAAPEFGVTVRGKIVEYGRIEEATSQLDMSNADPVFERLLGIEMKRDHYRQGRAFCDAVTEATDEATLARIWDDPDAMPSLPEIEEPRLWLARTV